MDKPGESSQTKLDSIPLYLIAGKATVWDPQTAATLHCVHNISGLRVGTLPGVTQQNGFLGLPITLMPEETAYLVNEGIAHLVPLATTPIMPTQDDVRHRTEARLDRIRQVEAAMRRSEEEKRRMAKDNFEKGGEKAKAKREARQKAKEEKERLKALAQSEQGVDESSFFAASTEPKESTVKIPIQPAVEDQLPPSSDASEITGNHFHAVSSHPLFPHLTYQYPITSLPHPVFQFPATPRDHALVATFTDLLKRGLRVGLGPRFGGEYLIYPGDYLRYHAHFTSQVLVRDEPLKPVEVVAWGRLGTGTKKAGLICCWDDGPADQVKDGGEVEYYSLEWANFG